MNYTSASCAHKTRTGRTRYSAGCFLHPMRFAPQGADKMRWYREFSSSVFFTEGFFVYCHKMAEKEN